MAEIISTAAALIAAFVLGYGMRGERERQKWRRIQPQPFRCNCGAEVSDEDLAQWEAELREGRQR